MKNSCYGFWRAHLTLIFHSKIYATYSVDTGLKNANKGVIIFS
jgi:hypothetical protein